MTVLKSNYKYRHSYKKILYKEGIDKKAEMDILPPPPPPNFLKIYGTSTASYVENKCSTYQRYASALFSPNSLYLNRLFPKKRTPKSKQHNFFTNNQLSHKTRKKIFRSCFLYRNVLSDWDNLIQFVIDNLITETCTVLVYKFPSFINYKLAIKQKEFLT